MACYHKGIILVVSFFYVLCLHIHVLLLLLQEVVCWVMLIPIATSCFLLNCNKFSIECDNGERAWSQELRAIPRRNCGAGGSRWVGGEGQLNWVPIHQSEKSSQEKEK